MGIRMRVEQEVEITNNNSVQVNTTDQINLE